MKKFNGLVLMFCLLTIGLISESCEKSEEILDPCESVTCENGGTCIDGTCDCPDGYLGSNCEIFDSSQVQILLADHTPLDLINGGVPIDSLYGKMYEGGLIFYLNTEDGNGMVAAAEDQSNSARWGCSGLDIQGLNNVGQVINDPETDVGARIGDGKDNTVAIIAECTSDGIASKICADLELNGKTDWFLPSRAELNMMYDNLLSNGLGNFSGIYHTSSEVSGSYSWALSFDFGLQGDTNKDVGVNVRAAREF